MQSKVVQLSSFSEPFFVHLDSRDAALWISTDFASNVPARLLAEVATLPWQLVIMENADSEFRRILKEPEDPSSPMVLRRGYPILVDGNPTDYVLPSRALPIYPLQGEIASSGIMSQLRKLGMLDLLRRAEPKELIVLLAQGAIIPPEIKALWQEGFRPTITFVSGNENLSDNINEWIVERAAGGSSAFINRTASEVCRSILQGYRVGSSNERQIVRVRSYNGSTTAIDIAGLDIPQNPLLSAYDLLFESDLRPLSPEDLSKIEIEAFFQNAASSWRPYAAGLPWSRESNAFTALERLLRRLDREGPQRNSIAYIRSEPGAGGTTFARSLAWSIARLGYPTLVAKSAPFAPTGLEVSTFLTRLAEASKASNRDLERLYEAPSLIVFDRDHWAGREAELARFIRVLEQSGRPACVLLVTGPLVGLDILSDARFHEISILNHDVPVSEAESFGRHINRFLAPHGPTRSPEEWYSFFQQSAVHAEDGMSVFWITLSFWVQRQIDMSETVQSWIYKQFQKTKDMTDVRHALVDIAAMSTERRPLPETLLPATIDWPVSQKLEQVRTEVAALGLAKLRRENAKYWAFAHDLIGRYLLRALFSDLSGRAECGLSEARSEEHLRFLILKRLASSPALGLAENLAVAEDFAVTIFKIDPDHGFASFVLLWREALDALDGMPRLLWDTSRALRHHSAISRRRIGSDPILFPMSPGEREALLERAINDLTFAIEHIPATEENDSNLNLFNSLARAYQDLYKAAKSAGATQEKLTSILELAQAATRRAFQLSPDNPFVVETLVRGLMQEVEYRPEKAAENAIEALSLIFNEMQRDRAGLRSAALNRLAESASTLLYRISADDAGSSSNPEIFAIAEAYKALAKGLNISDIFNLEDVPAENRIRAAEILSSEPARGNLQAIRMLYLLRALNAPFTYEPQLELLEELQYEGYPLSPQLRLEMGLLFQQCGKHSQAKTEFKNLRHRWKTSDQFVEVPDRLRWLRGVNGEYKQVTARVGPSGLGRSFAIVYDLENTSVPFRAEEFATHRIKPGTELRGYISFSHNGPFFRPFAPTRG